MAAGGPLEQPVAGAGHEPLSGAGRGLMWSFEDGPGETGDDGAGFIWAAFCVQGGHGFHGFEVSHHVGRGAVVGGARWPGGWRRD